MEIEIVAATEEILRRFETLSLNPKANSKMELKVLSDTLPIFEPGGNLSIFITEVDRLMRFAEGKLDDGQKYLLGGIIRNKIRGEARNTIAFQGDEDWTAIKAALLARYGDQRSEELLVTNLDQCVQNPAETYLEFYHSVVSSYHALLQNITLNVDDANTLSFKKQLYKEYALKAFKMGILQPYKSYLSHFDLDTLEKCLVKCQTYDNMKSEWEYRENIRKTKFPQKQKPQPQLTNTFKPRPFVPTTQKFNNKPFQQTYHQPNQSFNQPHQPFHQPHQQFRSGSGFTRNNKPFPPNRLAIKHEPTPMSGVSVQKDVNNLDASHTVAVGTANVGSAQSIDSAQGQASASYEQAFSIDPDYYNNYNTYEYSQNTDYDTYAQNDEWQYEPDFLDVASTDNPT